MSLRNDLITGFSRQTSSSQLSKTAMKNELQALVCKILGETQYSARTEKLLACLSDNGVKNVGDLEYLDKEFLENLGILSNNEIDAILNKITRMTLEGALEVIFKGRGSRMERVREVRDCLKSCGAERAEDLKYFDWGSLKNTNNLSEMEIEKIMLFVRTNFPDEYKEHKTKKIEADRLAREIDLIRQKNESETLLAKMRNKTQDSTFRPKFVNVHKEVNGPQSEDEQREPLRNVRHEEYDFNQLLTLLFNIFLMLWLIFKIFAKPLEHAVKLLIGFIFSMLELIIGPTAIGLRRTILGPT